MAARSLWSEHQDAQSRAYTASAALRGAKESVASLRERLAAAEKALADAKVAECQAWADEEAAFKSWLAAMLDARARAKAAREGQ